MVLGSAPSCPLFFPSNSFSSRATVGFLASFVLQGCLAGREWRICAVLPEGRFLAVFQSLVRIWGLFCVFSVFRKECKVFNYVENNSNLPVL